MKRERPAVNTEEGIPGLSPNDALRLAVQLAPLPCGNVFRQQSSPVGRSLRRSVLNPSRNT
jgi:hypothetical protein